MKAYYLIAAVVAGVAAIAMAAQLRHEEVAKHQNRLQAESEAEAWFI